MTSPLITTRPAVVEPGRRVVTRPEWSTVAGIEGSNTAGHGVAAGPRRRSGESCGTVTCRREHPFDDMGLAGRIRRRASVVLTSPGMVLLGGLTSVLLIGLSPLLTATDGTATDTVPADSAGHVRTVPAQESSRLNAVFTETGSGSTNPQGR